MSPKILIVEDDACSRNGLRDLFRADGYAVEACGDGLQGFRLFRALPFDVALVDLNLPSVLGVPISGWDFIRMLRAYLPDLPVVVLTAEEQTRTVADDARTLRVAAILHKPVTPSRLKALIAALVSPNRVKVPLPSRQPVQSKYRRSLKRMLAAILVGVLVTPS